MQYGTVASKTLDLFTDNAKFATQRTTRIINIGQQGSKTDGAIIHDFAYDQREGNSFGHRKRLTG
jgi:hypothetical protein